MKVRGTDMYLIKGRSDMYLIKGRSDINLINGRSLKITSLIHVDLTRLDVLHETCWVDSNTG